MNSIQKSLSHIAWLQSIVAMMGSLYFSEILKYPPCLLCWYQRIAIYPLVAIIAVGLIRQDRGLPYYVLPLSITGMAIALYHNLLYYQILPESNVPCSQGVSCTTQFFAWFGFVTIPLLSLAAFGVVTLCMIAFLNVGSVSTSKGSQKAGAK